MKWEAGGEIPNECLQQALFTGYDARRERCSCPDPTPAAQPTLFGGEDVACTACCKLIAKDFRPGVKS